MHPIKYRKFTQRWIMRRFSTQSERMCFYLFVCLFVFTYHLFIVHCLFVYFILKFVPNSIWNHIIETLKKYIYIDLILNTNSY